MSHLLGLSWIRNIINFKCNFTLKLQKKKKKTSTHKLIRLPLQCKVYAPYALYLTVLVITKISFCNGLWLFKQSDICIAKIWLLLLSRKKNIVKHIIIINLHSWTKSLDLVVRCCVFLFLSQMV